MSEAFHGYGGVASHYRHFGWAGVLPLPTRCKTPPPEGYTGRHGRDPGDSDIDEWVRRHPDGNVALRLGHDIIGIDYDCYKNPGARTELDGYVGCTLPATCVSTSRTDDSGIGFYRVQPPPEGKVWASAPIPGVEIIQYHHRYAVVWPSVHPEGRTYAWYKDGIKQDDWIPAPDDLAWLPDEAYEALLEDDGDFVLRDPVFFELSGGEMSRKVRERLRTGLEACDGAGGSRHDRINELVCGLIRLARNGELGVQPALDALRARFLVTVGLERDDADKEFDRMVRGGIELVEGTELKGQAAIGPDGFRLTESGNSARFIAQYGDQVLYERRWGKWLVYQQGRWELDHHQDLVTQFGKGIGKSLFSIVAEAETDALRKETHTWAKISSSARSIAATIRLSQGVSTHTIDYNYLDAKPELLNCRNGTVDLRTGRMREHEPNDLCTRQARALYDPSAVAPLWEQCLQRWQPDPEMRDYLQREAGSGACGYPTELFSIHHGHGGNGKSQYFGAIERVLGDYAIRPHRSLFMSVQHEEHRTVMASLFRVRLAVAAETRSAYLADEKVKELTGTDRLSARRMREDEWEFEPTHTLILFSNHRPQIRGRDEGIWRRIRLVPWEVTIPTAERDSFLAQKLAREYSGILRWLVEGAKAYLERGLSPPAHIQALTDSYRTEEDTVGRFLAENGISFGPGRRIEASDLARVHEEWCRGAGIDGSWHMRMVSERFKEEGAMPRRGNRGRYWDGGGWPPKRGPQDQLPGTEGTRIVPRNRP